MPPNCASQRARRHSGEKQPQVVTPAASPPPLPLLLPLRRRRQVFGALQSATPVVHHNKSVSGNRAVCRARSSGDRSNAASGQDNTPHQRGRRQRQHSCRRQQCPRSPTTNHTISSSIRGWGDDFPRQQSWCSEAVACAWLPHAGNSKVGVTNTTLAATAGWASPPLVPTSMMPHQRPPTPPHGRQHTTSVARLH